MATDRASFLATTPRHTVLLRPGTNDRHAKRASVCRRLRAGDKIIYHANKRHSGNCLGRLKRDDRQGNWPPSRTHEADFLMKAGVGWVHWSAKRDMLLSPNLRVLGGQAEDASCTVEEREVAEQLPST